MVWTVIAWGLLLLGLLVAARGLLWDRAGFRGRPRRRCRRCWYDLTSAVEGDEGYRCSECGRVHRTIRSMRKTRRSRRLLAVAVLLLIGAYASAVWPRVSANNFANGWMGAVPTPALILLLPVLDDEPGSYTRPQGTPFAQRPLAAQISAHLTRRLYQEDETSWFEHWLFYRVAKRTHASVLTDRSTQRGHVLAYVYGTWSRQGRLWAGEEAWARSVYHLEMELPEWLPQMSPVHGRVIVFRRLLEDRACRVRIHKRLYEVRDNTLRPVGLRYRERWDGTVRVQDSLRWSNFVGSMENVQVAIRGTIFEGDRTADIWWPVGGLREARQIGIVNPAPTSTHATIGAMDAYRLVEDTDAMRAWLESHIEIEFEWVMDRVGNRIGWPRGVEFSMPQGDEPVKLEEGFTFGGSIYLMAQIEGHEYEEVIATLDPTWWALRVRDGFVEFVGHRQWVGIEQEPDGSGLEYLATLADTRVESMWIEIHPNDAVVGGGSYAPLWDPDVERVLPTIVRLEFTEFELRDLLEKMERDAP